MLMNKLFLCRKRERNTKSGAQNLFPNIAVENKSRLKQQSSGQYVARLNLSLLTRVATDYTL